MSRHRCHGGGRLARCVRCLALVNPDVSGPSSASVAGCFSRRWFHPSSSTGSPLNSRPSISNSAPFRFEMALARSEEHTSELQSHSDLVCRLLLEKKKKKK